MCVVKTPKITNPTNAATEKKLPILTNPLLDGVDATGNLRIARNSLRIDRNPATAAVAPSGLAVPLGARI